MTLGVSTVYDEGNISGRGGISTPAPALMMQVQSAGRDVRDGSVVPFK